jgi:hypothetical protein
VDEEAAIRARATLLAADSQRSDEAAPPSTSVGWLESLWPPPQPVPRIAQTASGMALTDAGATLLHSLPISLVQMSDYTTDLCSIAVFYRKGMIVFCVIGLGAIGLSILCAWFIWWGFLHYYKHRGLSARNWKEALIFTLLAPLNLHTLYLSLLHATEKARLPRDPNADELAKVAARYEAFLTCKVAETGIESVPLAILTAAALTTSESTGDEAVLISSLGLSLLSMTYGFYGHVTLVSEGRHGPLPKGARLQAFLCVLVHVVWAVAACSTALAADSLGAIRWVGLAALLAAAGAAGLHALISNNAPWSVTILIMSMLASPIIVIMDTFLLLPAEDSAVFDTSRFQRATPTLRRLLLAALAALALLADFSWWRACYLALLCALDIAGTKRLFLLLGVEPDPRSSPKLTLVPVDSPRRCIFSAAPTFEAPLILVSHPGLAIMTAHDNPVHTGGWSSLPLAIGLSDHALTASWEGSLLTFDDGRVLTVSSSALVTGAHIRVTMHAAGRHRQIRPGRLSSREFRLNDDRTISPSAAPNLVLGVQFEPVAVAEPPTTVPARRRSTRRGSLKVAMMEPSDALMLLSPTHMPLFDALEELVLQLSEKLPSEADEGMLRRSNVPALRTRSEEMMMTEAQEETINASLKAGAQRDLLDVCTWLINGAVNNSTRHSTVELPSALPQGLRSASPKLVTALLATVEAYLPNSTNGSHERTLTTALLHFASNPASLPPPAVAPPEHELRAVLLAYGLDACIWETAKRQASAQSKKGGGVFAFNADSFYSWSHGAVSVSWFVSHAWPDESANKLTMLRFFLCVVNLLGALLVACPLLALYLIPVGIALEGQGITKWWQLPLVPLSVLASACLWVGLSYVGLMPRKLTPWGSSSTSVWLGAAAPSISALAVRPLLSPALFVLCVSCRRQVLR